MNRVLREKLEGTLCELVSSNNDGKSSRADTNTDIKLTESMYCITF